MSRSKRNDFDESLATLRRIRIERPTNAEALLRPLLENRSHYLASEAAAVCGELELSGLAPDLVDQFRRVHAGTQPDQGCAVARASIGSLGSLGTRARGAYLLALAMVRLEPNGEGGLVDIAIPIRIAAASALVETEGDDALFDVLPLLADSEADVRAGSAKAIGALQTAAAASALFVKLISGDSSADVSGACLSAMLVVDRERFAPLVVSHLAHDDDDLASLAAIALAESRVPQALDAIRAAIECHGDKPRSRALFVAMAVLRSEESERYLLDCLKRSPVHLAEHALYALAIHRDRTELADAVRAIVKARKSRELQRMFDRSFS